MGFNWKKEIFTIPNLLSLFRLVLIPVYIRLYLRAETPEAHLLAGAVLAVSCFTDAVDGKIARMCNMVSHVGKLLDPLADKCTQFALTLCLSTRYPVLLPVLGLFVVKELFQLIAVIVSLRKGKALPGALLTGKVCTTVFFVSLLFLVLVPQVDTEIVQGIARLNFGFLSLSFLRYIFAYCGKHNLLEDIRPDE